MSFFHFFVSHAILIGASTQVPVVGVTCAASAFDCLDAYTFPVYIWSSLRRKAEGRSRVLTIVFLFTVDCCLG